MDSINDFKKIKLDRDPYPIKGEVVFDEYGAYMTGTFKVGTTLLVVSHENDKWHLSIKSNTPLGLHRISELRYQFIPNDVKMAHILRPREQNVESGTHVNLWEVE